MSDARSDEAASEVVASVQFSFYSDEEAKKLSVKAITKPELLDAKGTPVLDGLYDPALGPLRDTDSCKSCVQLSIRCPGHFGHIDLAKPLYNPLLFSNLKGLLKITCFHCHRFKMGEEKVKIYASELDLIIQGDIVAARNLRDLSLSDSFTPEEYMAENVTHSTIYREQPLTSLQYAELKNVISNFLKKSPKKCENCERLSPKITSPTFGWLNKATKGSDIRADFILQSNLGLASVDGDKPDTHTLSDIENGEVLQSHESPRQTDEKLPITKKASKKARKHLEDLPVGFLEQMNSSGLKHLLPSEVERILEGLWVNNRQLCNIICDMQWKSSQMSQKSKSYSMYFLKTLLVPPSRFRPPAGSSTRGVLEHPQNVLLSKVLESNISLRSLIASDPDHPDIVRKWMDLQRTVNIFFDSSKGFVKSEKETTGVRQLLERKSGILRQKMMGKRVNFACRSVISPDPYLAVNEIGIPPYFALRLTYPERVTPWNVDRLRNAVDNGADLHPGATHYKDREKTYKLQAGRQMRNSISRKLLTSRGVLTQPGRGPESEFEGKVVYRHLKDGDIVLVNRQPTLHKPSMMAHIVRVLEKEKTLRMHYANCSTYNADFDGDEMNVHLPQDEISRAEAINIVNANKQYIVPTNGEPIRGLIQDHIISAVLLTMKDTFLTRDEYHELLCACVPSTRLVGQDHQNVSAMYSVDDIQPLLPAIWKPIPLWTGKQVISAILCYITRGHAPFSIKKIGRIKKEYFTENCSEQIMYIFNNELVHGMIDKAQFGEFGLVHTVHELYGADTAGTLLSIFSHLFTLYLQIHGFTCGLDDLLLDHNSDLERKRILEKSEDQSEEVHLRFTATKSSNIDPVELHREIEEVIQSNGDSATIRLDRMMSNSLNSLTSVVNNTLFPNGLLKPFPRNCLSLMTASGAKGGQVNLSQISSLLGQQELEGKRVPRMVSGKTLPSFPPWDISSRAGGFISDRFLTGLRPQEYYFHCMAGRDGLVDTAIKTSRSGYLQRCLIKNLECLKVCYDYTVRDADGSVIQFTYGEDGVDVLRSSFLTELEVLAANHKVVLEELSRRPEDSHLLKSNGYIDNLPCMLREKVMSFKKKEKGKAKSCLSKKQQGLAQQIRPKDLTKIVELKYLSSLAEPGESVGVIAAQSIGEPSTQMTLNTFHFAGRGERNVTLGMPRLQELLMNANERIRTPIMKCPLHDGKSWEDAEHLAAKFRRISVADVIQSMEVCTLPFCIHNNAVSTKYKLKMKLYPLDLYPPHSAITLDVRSETLRTSFVNALQDAILKHLITLSKINDITVSQIKESNVKEARDDDEPKNNDDDNDDGGGGGGGGDDDDDSDIGEDLGADAEKSRRQRSDEMEYDDDIEKENSAIADETDGEPRSGFESEIDQVEPNEDFTMGGEATDTDSEAETPESESKSIRTSGSETEKKAMKSAAKKKSGRTSWRKKKEVNITRLKVGASKLEIDIIIAGEEPHILLAEIAQRTAKKVYLKEHKKIENCSVAEWRDKDKKGIELQTAGVNFSAFWDLEDHLNISKLESNDVHAMLNTYGVEAARATIINEVNNVFVLYGIHIDFRHMSLIADFMTSHGGYRPLNRLGMGNFSTSPFTKMTYETATKFIFQAAASGEVDQLESPSANISLGKPAKLGTGCFDLLQNFSL